MNTNRNINNNGIVNNANVLKSPRSTKMMTSNGSIRKESTKVSSSTTDTMNPKPTIPNTSSNSNKQQQISIPPNKIPPYTTNSDVDDSYNTDSAGSTTEVNRLLLSPSRTTEGTNNKNVTSLPPIRNTTVTNTSIKKAPTSNSTNDTVSRDLPVAIPKPPTIEYTEDTTNEDAWNSTNNDDDQDDNESVGSDWDPDSNRQWRNPKAYIRQSTINRHNNQLPLYSEENKNSIETTNSTSTVTSSTTISSNTPRVNNITNSLLDRIKQYQPTSVPILTSPKPKNNITADINDNSSILAIPEHADIDVGAADIIPSSSTKNNKAANQNLKSPINQTASPIISPSSNRRRKTLKNNNPIPTPTAVKPSIVPVTPIQNENYNGYHNYENDDELLEDNQVDFNNTHASTEIYDDFTDGAENMNNGGQSSSHYDDLSSPPNVRNTNQHKNSFNSSSLTSSSLLSTNISPCGGTIIYGVSSESVNPSGSATMDVAAATAAELANRKSKIENEKEIKLQRNQSVRGITTNNRIPSSINTNYMLPIEENRYDTNANCYSSESNNEDEPAPLDTYANNNENASRIINSNTRGNDTINDTDTDISSNATQTKDLVLRRAREAARSQRYAQAVAAGVAKYGSSKDIELTTTDGDTTEMDNSVASNAALNSGVNINPATAKAQLAMQQRTRSLRRMGVSSNNITAATPELNNPSASAVTGPTSPIRSPSLRQRHHPKTPKDTVTNNEQLLSPSKQPLQDITNTSNTLLSPSKLNINSKPVDTTVVADPLIEEAISNNIVSESIVNQENTLPNDGRPSEGGVSDMAYASERRSSISMENHQNNNDNFISTIPYHDNHIMPVYEEQGSPLPDLPVPDPLFNVRMKRDRSPYRPSTSLNEDDYDFAIIVRAVVTPKQEAALARAKAQADSMSAAARRQAGFGGAGIGITISSPIFSPSIRNAMLNNNNTVDYSNGLKNQTSNLSNTSSAVWKNSTVSNSTVDMHNARTPTKIVGMMSPLREERSTTKQNKLDHIVGTTSTSNLNISISDTDGPTQTDADHDSASESDSNSGSESEDNGPEEEVHEHVEEDEKWYDEWDNESSDGEGGSNNPNGSARKRKTNSKNKKAVYDDEDDDEEDEYDEDDEYRRRSKKSAGKKNKRKSKKSKSNSRESQAGMLAAIVGIAEKGIAKVRKSLGGPGHTISQPPEIADGHRSDASGTGNRKRKVKFDRKVTSQHQDETVITILPRSPIPTHMASSLATHTHMQSIISPAISAALNGNNFQFSPAPGSVAEEDGVANGVRVHKCAEILAALRTAGLQAKRVRSLSRRTWLIKIKCPEWRLEIEAEKLRLRMRRRDGGWSKFKRNMRAAFVPAIAADEEEIINSDSDDEQDRYSKAENGNLNPGLPDDNHTMIKKNRTMNSKGPISLFHSSDRQTLIDNILRSSSREGGADLGDGSPLGAYVTHMFPLHMLARLNELRSDWLAVWRPQRSHGDRDRIGTVEATWYAEPVLIDLNGQQSTSGNIFTRGWNWMVGKHIQDPTTYEHQSTQKLDFQPNGKAPSLPKDNDPSNYNIYPTANEDDEPPEKKPTFSYTPTNILTSAYKNVVNSVAMRWCCTSLPIRLIFTMYLLIAKFIRSTGRLWSRLMTQPLDRVAAYFGETIAFYFAWLEFYTQWLLFPSLMGILLFLGQLYYGAVDIAYVPLFSLTMALWSILFLECWKRRNAVLAQRWGVLHYEDEEAVRPQFAGAWKQDIATGEVLRVYPAWRRALKYAVTVPFVLAWVIGVVTLMIFVYSVRDHMLAQYEQHELIIRTRDAILSNSTLAAYVNSGQLKLPSDIDVDLGKSVMDAWNGGLLSFLRGDALAMASTLRNLGIDPTLGIYVAPASSITDSSSSTSSLSSMSFSLDLNQFSNVDFERFGHYFESKGDWRWWIVMVLPPVFLGLLNPLIDYIFSKLALRLNSWENHATESEFRNHRIAKVFFSRFTVSFISLFYYAFSPQHSVVQLTVQLAAFLVVGQLWNNILEVILPTCLRQCRECKFKRRLRHAEESGLTEGRRGRRLIRHAQAQAWVESRMPRYDSFNDYAEMLIQFGYVTFFSWAFPLAPVFALINNLIEMRTDAYKLCYNTQRPIAHKAGGIGVWYNVLVAMSLLAVLTNCAHLALVSRQFNLYFPGLTDSQKMLVVFVFEHLVLSLRLIMPYLVPPTPSKVKRRIQRDNFALARLQGRRSLGNAL